MGCKGRVCAYTLGCKVNQYDTNAMLELMAAEGFSVVPWGQTADIYLINTCTVTNTADRKSRNMIRRAVKQNPDAVVCVCGCLAQKAAEAVLRIPGVDAAVGTDDRAHIVEIVRECLAGKPVNAVHDVGQKDLAYEEIGVKTSGELTRGYIKVQEGCNNFCSYCIIPYVRGRVRSRRSADVEAEARALAKNGVKEIVLTGIHISSYGTDSKESLIGLLGRLNAVPGILRIRLGSLEPHILTDGFLRELSGLNKICPHFHVSLQSGSTAVLHRMNRKYTAEEYAEYIGTVRRYYAAPAITTDVITGFPGESEEEFECTRRFADQIGFSRVHVFPYSEREGTPAAHMPGAVPVAVRRRRAQQLIADGKRIEQRYMTQFLQTAQEVLFEEVDRTGAAVGYTDRYLRVAAAGGRPGSCENVLLGCIDGDIIKGEIQTR